MDFDHDDNPDLAAAIYTNSTVSVALGNGDGSFALPVSYTVETGPTALAAGFLNNNDNHPDLAVANKESDSISVLLGLGNGSFAPPTQYAVGSNPVDIILSDLDNDGDTDLAVVTTLNVSVLLGTGDGSFSASTNFYSGQASSLDAGDVNGDNYPDLIVSRPNQSSLGILLGNGNGTFQSVQTLSTSKTPIKVIVHTIDDDSALDLCVVHQSLNDVSVFKGAGNGNFTLSGHFGTGRQPTSGIFAETDGDAVLDLIVTNLQDDSVSVLHNNSSPPPCLDGDGDGYGDPSNPTCTYPEWDCDDTSPAVHPGASEGPDGDPTCSDTLDNDCDGLADLADLACIP
jgi:hypothetical protein